MASSVKDVSGLKGISDDFSLNYFGDDFFSLKSKTRGLNYFKEGYIHKVNVAKTENQNGKIDISGRCYRSMRKGESPHNLHLAVKENKILDAYCSCTAGAGGRCSHMVGLVKTIQQFKILGLEAAPAEQSCTSIPQTWHIPRGNKISPVAASQIVVVKAKETRKKAPIQQKMLKSVRLPTFSDTQLSVLKSVKDAPISDLHLDCTPRIASEYGQILLGSVIGYQKQKNDVKFNTEANMTCGNTAFPLEAKIKLPPWFATLLKGNIVSNPAEVEEKTRDQYLNQEWQRYRAMRITASQMHKVVYRKKTPTEAMLRSLFSPKPFTSVATDYGISREKIAKEKYVTHKSVQNVHIHDCGVVINNAYPFLAATPDAKVCEKNDCGILEVKCPFAAREMSLFEACDKLNNFVLCQENGNVHINKNHDYYVQIQGQLLVTGAPWCDLAVYTSKDFFIERVLPNIPFMTNMLLKLALFYKFHGVPYLHVHSTLQ